MLLFLMLLVAAPPAEGTLTVNGQTAALRYAYAVSCPNPFHKTRRDTRVILADRKLSATDEAALGRIAGLNAIVLQVTWDKRIIGCTVFSPHLRKGIPIAGIGMQKLVTRVFVPGRIAGRLLMEQPEVYAGNVYRYDVSFDVIH
ncbi:MAG TPA: hypothetical protein VGF69_24345 [Thermoanaerobaculia bacterium]|jgi:hypothetical protein